MRVLLNALENQKTISIDKLNFLLDVLEIDLKDEESKVREIKFLKGEIKKLVKENKRLKRMMNNE